MATVTATTDLTPFAEQKVVLKKKSTKDGAPVLEELTGTAVAATTGMGILFKPKGRQQTTIIEVADIEEIDFAPAEVKPLKQRSLVPLKHGEARAHLVYVHGYGRTGDGNVDQMTEDAAMKFHDSIDHDNLGHKHEVKADKPVETESAVSTS